MPNVRILIADDQQDILETLHLTLKNEGWSCKAVTTPEAISSELQASEYDLVLMDLNYQRDTTSGQEGLRLLSKIRDLDEPPPVVVMTAWGSIELAVEALRLGAQDFIEKPWDNLRLLRILRAQLDLHQSRQQTARLSGATFATGEQPFITQSDQVFQLLKTLESVASSEASVLITGENGTGKNLLAAMLHRRSTRSANSLLTVDVGAITETLFESEMFGHTKGAFTDARETKIGRLELADGGTLFLDEIANLSPAQQSRLLRVIESGEFERVGSSQTRRADIRFVSATNEDIEQRIEQGQFRQDLFYRLNTVVLNIPALRDRPEDIEPLAEHFLQSLAARYRKPSIEFSTSAIKTLLSYHWPGNVRELAHAIERALLVCDDKKIQAHDFALPQARELPSSGLHSLADMEQRLIKQTLKHYHNNISQCAQSLGISRSSLYRKLESYGLDQIEESSD